MPLTARLSDAPPSATRVPIAMQLGRPTFARATAGRGLPARASGRPIADEIPNEYDYFASASYASPWNARRFW